MKKAQIFESLPLAIILTLSGGFMDAYSYLSRGKVFANAQTGNIVLFGTSLANGDYPSALRHFVPILAFAIGIAAAELARHRFKVRNRFHWMQIVVLIEAAIFFGVAFMPQSLNLLVNSLISLACGAQVSSFRKVIGYSMATTMCIGNLREAVSSACGYLFSKNKLDLKRAGFFAGMIGIFALGAIIGDLFIKLWQEYAIMVSGVLMLAATLLMLNAKEE